MKWMQKIIFCLAVLTLCLSSGCQKGMEGETIQIKPPGPLGTEEPGIEETTGEGITEEEPTGGVSDVTPVIGELKPQMLSARGFEFATAWDNTKLFEVKNTVNPISVALHKDGGVEVVGQVLVTGEDSREYPAPVWISISSNGNAKNQDIFSLISNRVWSESEKHIGFSDVKVDIAGNIYILGTLKPEDRTAVKEIRLFKFNGAYQHVWDKSYSKRWDGGDAVAVKLVIDQGNNVNNAADDFIYIAGNVAYDVDGNNDYNKHMGKQDVVLLRYNFSGDLLNIVQAGTEKNDIVHGLTVDKNGRLYTSGYYFDVDECKVDSFIFKFDSSESTPPNKRLEVSYLNYEGIPTEIHNIEARHVEVPDRGEKSFLYVTGRYMPPFVPGTADTSCLIKFDKSKMFVKALNADNPQIVVTKYDYLEGSTGESFTMSDDNIYVAGCENTKYTVFKLYNDVLNIGFKSKTEGADMGSKVCAAALSSLTPDGKYLYIAGNTKDADKLLLFITKIDKSVLD